MNNSDTSSFTLPGGQALVSRRGVLGAGALAAIGLAIAGSSNGESPQSSTESKGAKLDDLEHLVTKTVAEQPVADLHTHCYSPRFGVVPTGFLSWGIDDLLTYHYLIAEVFRVVPLSQLSYDDFWAMSKQRQADHIWKHLFVERAPVSEACRGVVTTLSHLGLDPNEKTLAGYRKWYASQSPDDFVDKVMSMARIERITMTNGLFDDKERVMWERDASVGDDPRFKPVLRCDQLLTDWPWAVKKLASWNYDVAQDLSGKTVEEVKRLLRYWLDRMKAEYLAMSLPPDWCYPNPANPAADRVLKECLLPVLAERDLAWSPMIGVNRGTNPLLRDGGDSGARAEVQSIANVCREFPNNKFLVTMLSLENQHELCVVARKFSNLMVFGCWWFLNTPSLIEQMFRMRLELLGTTFVAQHSDARVLDQLIYKWDHNRKVIGKVLTDKFADLAASGFNVTKEHIKADVARLMRDNYKNFVSK